MPIKACVILVSRDGVGARSFICKKSAPEEADPHSYAMFTSILHNSWPRQKSISAALVLVKFRPRAFCRRTRLWSAHVEGFNSGATNTQRKAARRPSPVI